MITLSEQINLSSNFINLSCRDILTQIYSITYMYYSLIGCFITVFLGWIVSYLVGTTESDLYDEHLLHPIARKISKWFPGPPRRFADKTQAPDVNSNNRKKTVPVEVPPVAIVQLATSSSVPTLSHMVEKADKLSVKNYENTLSENKTTKPTSTSSSTKEEPEVLERTRL